MASIDHTGTGRVIITHHWYIDLPTDSIDLQKELPTATLREERVMDRVEQLRTVDMSEPALRLLEDKERFLLGTHQIVSREPLDLRRPPQDLKIGQEMLKLVEPILDLLASLIILQVILGTDLIET
jgi:hypothetical protein